MSKPYILYRALYLTEVGTDLGHMLLLNMNGKPYVGISMTHSHLTLRDLDISKSRSLRLQSLYIS